MGHGASRELTQGVARELVLSDELTAKLTAALEKLDRIDPKFKSARDEERFAQITKTWHRLCAEIDGHLRSVAKLLIHTHQLALEVGSEGGSINAKPFIDENGGSLERLYFKLHENAIVVVSGQRTILTASLKDVSYEWVENAVVEWAVNTIESRAR